MSGLLFSPNLTYNLNLVQLFYQSFVFIGGDTEIGMCLLGFCKN